MIATVNSTKDRAFYRAIVERIPELYIRAVLKKIRTAPARTIGHPGAFFFNQMVQFAETLGIQLPEPVNNDCAVPLCQLERVNLSPAPFLCTAHRGKPNIFVMKCKVGGNFDPSRT